MLAEEFFAMRDCRRRARAVRVVCRSLSRPLRSCAGRSAESWGIACEWCPAFPSRLTSSTSSCLEHFAEALTYTAVQQLELSSSCFSEYGAEYLALVLEAAIAVQQLSLLWVAFQATGSRTSRSRWPPPPPCSIRTSHRTASRSTVPNALRRRCRSPPPKSSRPFQIRSRLHEP